MSSLPSLHFRTPCSVLLVSLALAIVRPETGYAQTAPDVPPGCAPAVASYPYEIPYVIPSDPEMTFPAAEGYQGAATDTYYASGILETPPPNRHRYGFLTIFAKNKDIFDLLSADLHVLALFDLDSGIYGTMSQFDLPPEYRRNNQKLDVTRGSLGVTYTSGASPTLVNRFVSRRSTTGNELCPFAYRLDLRGTDDAGFPMELGLDAVAIQVPQAVGGPEKKGVITVFGQPGTHSYYQPLALSGHLKWGDIDADVMGSSAWLDRQWFPEYVGAFNGALADHYGHQWASISLDNGFQLGLWRHFDRYNANTVTDFTGLTITRPDGTTEFKGPDEFTVEVMSYVRDPDRAELEPLLGPVQMFAGKRSNIRYFFDDFRLKVQGPSGESSPWITLVSTPLVAKPFHKMPVDYVHGPTAVTGSIQTSGGPAAVSGYGFHERTLPLSWADELIIVLRDSLLYLPSDAGISASRAQALADLAWKAQPLIEREQLLEASVFLKWKVRPALSPIAEPYRSHLQHIVDDVIHQLIWVPLQTASSQPRSRPARC